jgi:hypothetical protein
VFPTHGGDVRIAVGGNIRGDMNALPTIENSNTCEPACLDQNLPYDMTALGSQLRLETGYTAKVSPTSDTVSGTSPLEDSVRSTPPTLG